MNQTEKYVLIQADKLEKVKKAYQNYRKSPKERLTDGYLKGRLDTLERYWKEFSEVHENLIILVPLDQRQLNNYFAENMFEELEEAYYIYKGEIMSKLESLVPVKGEFKPISSSKTSSCEVQLPRISLQPFNGNYTEWQSFHDLFLALVHNNESLQDVQKLHYLKGSLIGEAEVLLRQFSITAENYTEAWSVLKKRYSNKRYIANCVFKKFFAQKVISLESATALRQLLDTSVECMSALKQLGLPTSHWDAIVNYSVVSKLDTSTHKEWEESISRDDTDDLPSFDRLKSFLENRFRTLEMVEPVNKGYKTVKTKMFHVTAPKELKCTFCSNDHYIYQCKQFSKQSMEDRYNFVQKNNLCFNCLIPNHTVFKCKQRTNCQICKKRHHSLLHREKKQASEETRSAEETNNKNKTQPTLVSAHTSNVPQVLETGQDILLATALVHVSSESGQSHVLRALLDQGSEASFVTARAVELLGLRKTKVSGVVSGVGEDNQMCIKHSVRLHIKSRYDISYSLNINAYVLKSLTRRLPAREIRGFVWPQVNEMNLADPTFSTPGRIDILLGAEVFGKIIDAGLMRGPGNVVAQKTHLGWILSGGTNPSINVSQHITSLHITRQVIEDNDLLKRFWEVESELYTKQSIWTKDEEKCEEIYQHTTKRDENGRYVVQLPLKLNIVDTVKSCGNTKQLAVSRLEQLERRFARNEQLKSEYTTVIHEYLQLGHMKKVEIEDECNAIYLAHHAVIRQDKETSRVRVVFDASARGSNGCSLNESMMVGPTIQPDLRSLIFRWRSHKICVIGDIVKMYRQVRMNEEHTDLQRIVWRDVITKQIESYKLLTVTFGTSAAPHLAVRTLQRLADDEEKNYPRGAPIIRNSFYMDDLMTGHEDLEEIKITCKEIDKLLKSGGFEMQKWSSNSEELLKHLSDNSKTLEPVREKKEIKLDKVIKILGLTWDRKNDTFKVSVNLPATRIPITKRVILSDVASLFDPFGWLSPVVITAKIMIQKLWLCCLGWDDELPSELVNEWINFRDELHELQTIEIPRWIKMSSRCKEVQLHGFSDASTLALAAVVYVRVVDENDVVHVTMLASKTKVAPLKQLTIPRLELCAAVLLARLLHEISGLLNIPMTRIFAWTDSMVVLSWLQCQPSRWQLFVGNRVSEIIQNIDNDRWRHVLSADNPADIASRGIKASELADNELWWTGPVWLRAENNEIERLTSIPDTEIERKKSFHTLIQDTPIWERFSSMLRMKRVVAQCKRFLDYKSKNKRGDIMTVDELNHIEECCVRYYQKLIYNQEFEDLKRKGKVRNKSSLIKFTPYLDEKDLLRVGGRLSKADLDENAKHPIIIPSKQHVTKLIIADAHTKTLHGTVQQVMTYIRTKYWVIGLKSAVRDFNRKCVVCIKDNALTKQQLMGQLPTARVTQQRAFYNSGVDFAGPVYLRTSKGRGHGSTKGYICLFVCMCTRAIHLEAVSDLTTQAFIAAFRRFVARRGHCAQLWSDNGTNFVGGNKELKLLWSKSSDGVAKQIATLLANDGTTWRFVPPKSANWGGLWESGVRSVKRHLVRVNGTTKLTFEEMSTLLAQVEACLNSRPICQLDETLDTLNPLTPGHFLVGENLINVPDVNYETKNVNLLTRWQLVQTQMQDFWRKWHTEYLNTLQQKQKWYDIVPSPCIGDIVIIKEEALPPAKWLLGKITTVHPGPDNLVRVATVECKGGHVLKRPLSKLILLPKASD